VAGVSTALWYAGRGFGVSSLVLLSLVMVLGILTRSGRPMPGLPRFAVAALHRTTSLTAVLFVALHVLTLSLDPYAQLHLVDTVVPFLGTFRPMWQGLGTVALDLIVLLVGSSLLRHRLGLRTWRVVHWTSYLFWPVAILHAFGNGTDGHAAWLLAVLGTCVAAVGGAVAWRLVGSSFAAEAAPAPVSAPHGLAGLR
jgi:sulfoxide reductase heme-binding subunit YedZ